MTTKLININPEEESPLVDPAVIVKRKRIVKDHWTASEVIRNMQANIQRRIEEGTTDEPALDQNSPANEGKTQQQIDQDILAEYLAAKDTIKVANPEIFPVVNEISDESMRR